MGKKVQGIEIGWRKGSKHFGLPSQSMFHVKTNEIQGHYIKKLVNLQKEKEDT